MEGKPSLIFGYYHFFPFWRHKNPWFAKKNNYFSGFCSVFI